jgi:hypothetical protein
MYQLHLTVREYIGSVGIRAGVSDALDDGTVVILAEIDEQMFERLTEDGDEFADMFDCLERFARKCRSNRRVASGVSSKTQD